MWILLFKETFQDLLKHRELVIKYKYVFLQHKGIMFCEYILNMISKEASFRIRNGILLHSVQYKDLILSIIHKKFQIWYKWLTRSIGTRTTFNNHWLWPRFYSRNGKRESQIDPNQPFNHIFFEKLSPIIWEIDRSSNFTIALLKMLWDKVDLFDCVASSIRTQQTKTLSEKDKP